MKKLTFSTILLTTLLVFSCSNGKDEPDQTDPTDVIITYTPQSLTASYEATELTLGITSTADWSITPEDDWCTVTPRGGSKNQETYVKVKVSTNGGAEARTTNLVVKSGGKTVTIPLNQNSKPTLNVSTAKLVFGAQASTSSVVVTANDNWTAVCSDAWVSVTPVTGRPGETTIEVKVQANSSKATREAVVALKSGELTQEIKIQQYSDEIITPEGYTLVWHDEFNSPNGSMPDESLWYYDVWPKGYVNNELQRYVAGKLGDEYTAIIEDGILNIIARKYGNEVISARLNTRELWTYGYFEARLKLPKGKGTWPAFWMMPANGNNWPHCGEIDIMEEVGVNPNYTSSSIHCTAYNHVIGTQKTAERYTAGAEEEFHVYALEWTAEYIRTYVDGKLLLNFVNDNKGDENTWPFSKPFHPILNLAWGGDWGGWNGVNENALPATYQIDYVRIFQKK